MLRHLKSASLPLTRLEGLIELPGCYGLGCNNIYIYIYTYGREVYIYIYIYIYCKPTALNRIHTSGPSPVVELQVADVKPHNYWLSLPSLRVCSHGWSFWARHGRGPPAVPPPSPPLYPFRFEVSFFSLQIVVKMARKCIMHLLPPLRPLKEPSRY